MNQLEREIKPIDITAEQFIELPRAIADSRGYPHKGQKHFATKFSEQDTKANPPVITDFLPYSWVPQVVILEGMFLINTVALGFHRNRGRYANFLFTRFVTPHYARGSSEVHILLNNPDLVMETPKVFEHLNRDTNQIPTFVCISMLILQNSVNGGETC